MKTIYSLRITSVAGFLLLCSLCSHAQLSNGGLLAGFGLDADTRANATKMGPSAGSNVYNDDWFGLNGGTGRYIIDTSNKEYYKALLQANSNISFQKIMSVPAFTRRSGRLWLGASYNRDFSSWPAGAGYPAAADSTTFTGTATNGNDPANWNAGIDASLTDKDDILDAFIHMRRNGNTVNDSLWLFAAMATKAAGDRHLDIECFKKVVTYNGGTGAFSTGGADLGHTQWLFDGAGNITQTGDVIITLTYSAAGTITVEVRIWVSASTYGTVVPALFNFGASFTGVSATPAFGYANVVSKSGGTAFGAAIGNRAAVTANDTTFNTPWGSSSLATGSYGWDSTYQSYQYVELGLNLSRIGIDPAFYTTMGDAECGTQFRTVFFKSRTLSAFASPLKDFVGPVSFQPLPVLDHTITIDTLTCREPVGTLRANSITTGGFYQWTLPSGSTVPATSLATNRIGTYVLEAAVASGCPVTKRDTIVVVSDSLQPVATAGVTTDSLGQTTLAGGDTTASDYSTPFGGSGGLTWSWTGPNGFTSTEQNPVIASTDTGNYALTVTELRNGCRSTVNYYYSLILLSSNRLVLTGRKQGSTTLLQWEKKASAAHGSYIVEKRTYDKHFIKIATIRAETAQQSTLSYQDLDHSYSDKIYRIKHVSESGAVYYSNTITVSNSQLPEYKLSIGGSLQDKNLVIEIASRGSQQGMIAFYSTTGELLQKQKIFVPSGSHRFPLNPSVSPANKMLLMVVYIDNELVLTKKLLNY
jgi:hypothetical protein